MGIRANVFQTMANSKLLDLESFVFQQLHDALFADQMRGAHHHENILTIVQPLRESLYPLLIAIRQKLFVKLGVITR